jgi:hypothetical protein
MLELYQRFDISNWATVDQKKKKDIKRWNDRRFENVTGLSLYVQMRGICESEIRQKIGTLKSRLDLTKEV